MAPIAGDNPQRSGGASADTSPATLEPSTLFEYKRVRVRRGAAGSSAVRRSRSFWRRFARRDPSEWLTIRVKYRGGPEAWVLVTARGETNAIPGHRQLIDVVMDVNNAR